MAEGDTQPTLHHRRTFSSPESISYGSDEEPLVSCIFSSCCHLFFCLFLCHHHHHLFAQIKK